jgi:hypothetical protein
VTRGPFFVTCQNPACRQRKQVPSAYKAKKQRYCSRRCVGVMTGTLRNIPREQRQVWGRRAGAVNRWKSKQRFGGLTKVEVFRAGYRQGWHRGVRYARSDAASGGQP